MMRTPQDPLVDEDEVWRPVHYPHLSQLYEVSNLGRVRSFHKGEAHILTPRFNKDGYPMVCMYDHGYRKGDSVHRLVCWAFHGPPSECENEAAHLDGDRKNAKASNLKWVSKLENTSHKWGHGTMLDGEKHPLSKLTKSQVIEILEALATGVTAKRLGEIYGITRHAIEDIRSGKNWGHVPRPAKLIERLTTGNGQNGANNHNARVTWDEVVEIRRRAASGEHVVTLGKEFGLSKAAVYKLIAGQTYKRALADDKVESLMASMSGPRRDSNDNPILS